MSAVLSVCILGALGGVSPTHISEVDLPQRQTLVPGSPPASETDGRGFVSALYRPTWTGIRPFSRIIAVFLDTSAFGDSRTATERHHSLLNDHFLKLNWSWTVSRLLHWSMSLVQTKTNVSSLRTPESVFLTEAKKQNHFNNNHRPE